MQRSHGMPVTAASFEPPPVTAPVGPDPVTPVLLMPPFVDPRAEVALLELQPASGTTMVAKQKARSLKNILT